MKVHFKIILIDETYGWCDDIIERAGKVYKAYLFDSLRATHCCELTPSYELHPLYSTALNPGEELHDEIRQHDDNDVVYRHCSGIDLWPEGSTHDFGEEEVSDDEDYERVIEDYIERCNCTCFIDLPKGAI